MCLQRKTIPRMIEPWTSLTIYTWASGMVSLLILRKSLMTIISEYTPSGQRTMKELYLRNPVSTLFLKMQQRQRLTSAMAQNITTAANLSRWLSGLMNTSVTIFLPRIWKNAPTMLPFEMPSRISTMSHIWNSCTPLKMLTSVLISDARKASLSTKRGTPTASSRYDHTAKLATLTTLSISILIKLQQFYQLISNDARKPARDRPPTRPETQRRQGQKGPEVRILQDQGQQRRDNEAEAEEVPGAAAGRQGGKGREARQVLQ